MKRFVPHMLGATEIAFRKKQGENNVRVLLTGNAGRIGQWQTKFLREAGYEIRTFDRVAKKKEWDWEHISGDLRDLTTIRNLMSGIDAVVHLGAIAYDQRGNDEGVFGTNVMGTWNVLQAGLEADVKKFMLFSSVNALGAVGGHRSPVHLPIADDYPRHPMSPYQLSKHVIEEMATTFSAKHGVQTISFRPGWVATPDDYDRISKHETKNDHWAKTEFWGYVDIRDVCEAVMRGLKNETIVNDAFLLMAADTMVKTPTRDLVEQFWPEIEWSGDRDAYFADNPYRSLFDTSHSAEVLGWTPKFSWRDARG